MKKLVFSISLILSYTFIAIAGVVKSIPAKADDFTNGNIVTITPSISETDLSNYNNALQILEYLRQGGTIDFSNVSDNYSSGDLLNDFEDLINDVGNGIDYYGNNIINNVFGLSSDTVQLSPNTKLKDRIGQFRSNLPSYFRNQSTDDTPTPTPTPTFPSEYNSYIDRLNKRDNTDNRYFWFYNFPNLSDSNFLFIKYPITDYTWVCNDYYGAYDSSFDNDSNWNTPAICPCDILSIYIYNTGTYDNSNRLLYSYSSNYSCYYTVQRLSDLYRNKSTTISFNWNTNTWDYTKLNFNNTNLNNDIAQTGAHSLSNKPLANILADICKYYKNVNIYVDGEPWSIVGNSTPISYNINLGTGTYLKETNQPIEYKFEIPVYVDVSDLIDKIQLAIDNKITLDFPYLNDLIVDTNGQQTLAVTVFSEDYTLDDLYVKDYGAMVPVFPLWVTYPVSLEHINTVATVGIVDVIPSDIIEVLGIFLIVGLFVFLCHRLME